MVSRDPQRDKWALNMSMSIIIKPYEMVTQQHKLHLKYPYTLICQIRNIFRLLHSIEEGNTVCVMLLPIMLIAVFTCQIHK